MIDSAKLKPILESYKDHFLEYWAGENNEKYKWEAVYHFQKNWNIDAEDFEAMIRQALNKTYNLLASGYAYPREMIFNFAKADAEATRNLFKNLFDESIDLAKRIDAFLAASEEIRIKYDDGTWKNHYQNTNAITTYLWLRYPDKYYIYKYETYRELAKELSANYKPKKNGSAEAVIDGFKMFDEICEVIKSDLELVNMIKTALTSECYSDPEFRTATIDFGFYYARHYLDELNPNDDENSWFPKDEVYSPELSVEDWVKLLDDESVFTLNSLAILKRLLDYGGAATCKQLSTKYGESSNFYNGGSSALAQRIAKKTACPVMDRDQVNSRWWPILYKGKLADKDAEGSYIWKIRDELREALNYVNLDEIPLYADKKEEKLMDNSSFCKNTILYGPPGTGKTFNTIIYAVALIENKTIDDIGSEAIDDYSSVKKRFDEYMKENRIAFVTFHQSYGYEEFIEGIKPIVTKDEQNKPVLEYSVESGLFKRFCERASMSEKNNPLEYGLNESPVVWKISLEGAGENETRRECLENNHIRIGWDEYGAEIKEDTDYPSGKTQLNIFVNKMKPGDIVLSCYSKTQIDAIGVITGDYEWSGNYGYYNRVRKVKWLLKDIREDIVNLNGGHVLTLSTVYELKIDPKDIIAIVKKHQDMNRYVFIIDEINRGNISRIFGELITLIEESKRLGAKEETTAILPYSSSEFGVPDNVYILGTMNTADRSIALMDTALRRRFNFVEMMPDTSVISGITVSDKGETLDVAEMLETINKRIEYLYDREHTIGHAFFTCLKEDNSIGRLSEVFRNKVIPLLQEYFYEDYEKIQLVLGDNDKSSNEYKFIIDEKADEKAIFKRSPQLDLHEKTYAIQNKAFDLIQSYLEITEKR